MDPVIAALIAGGVIGWAVKPDGKVVPISPAMLADSEVPFAKKIEIDTSIANDNKEYNEAGAMLFVKNPTTPTTTVYIRFNNKVSELFELTALRKVKGPFGKFFITNEAGAGTLTLIITRGFAFEFVESEVDVASIHHVSTHQDGGVDELHVDGLAGLLADDQHVLDAEVLAVAAALVHAVRHQDGGDDEIDVTGLAGLLAADQHVLDVEVLLVAAALVHAARHENGGLDEISLTGLSGEPADTVNKTGAQTIAGIKTFSSIPVLPAADPTVANQATRKAYVDGQIALRRDGIVVDLQFAADTNLRKAYKGAGTMTNPELLNTLETALSATATINEYGIIDISHIVRLTQFRQFGDVTNDGVGRWKIQYWNVLTRAYVDWVTAIPTRVTADWGGWDSSGGEIVTDKIKLICTTADTGDGNSYIAELELKY